MKRVNTYLAVTFLSAAMLFSSAAQAMEIRQFDKMAIQDQGKYVGLLVSGIISSWFFFISFSRSRLLTHQTHIHRGHAAALRPHHDGVDLHV